MNLSFLLFCFAYFAAMKLEWKKHFLYKVVQFRSIVCFVLSVLFKDQMELTTNAETLFTFRCNQWFLKVDFVFTERFLGVRLVRWLFRHRLLHFYGNLCPHFVSVCLPSTIWDAYLSDFLQTIPAFETTCYELKERLN